ncbi:HPF/RaiA family ribosome-associated protein [Sandaracinobacteroides sp. A072]|uniref:HPF/RaiA family ribosome-associated protein n=1 Tax=Sandaracinobacteroides sp. A072 TaxID=3461146 RepID=UPI00404362ED
MDFQFNTANDITGDDDVRARVEASIRQKLARIAEDITRVELHVRDFNGQRGGTDKRAVLEIRPRGYDPISVSHDAATVDLAANGAADKALTAFDREMGRRTNRKGH